MPASTTVVNPSLRAQPDAEPAVAPPAGEAVDVDQAAIDALPIGTRLDEFEVTRILGAGGFGIVYLALDHVLLRYVAIKEFMPASLAGRVQGETVAVRAPSHLKTYAAGLESFFNEARMLASFDHPSLVKVHRFWKANGTAYMAMQYYPGQTLREARQAMQAPPGEAWLRALVDPLLGALELLHDEGIYHRDIAPDNILLLPDGRPVLLDFGSARQVIGDRTQSLTAILKPNFAPIEQYADEPGMRQGPWTDLYALGATLHFMLSGKVPVPAVMRSVRDTLPSLASADDDTYPDVARHVLAAIDWTLALAPENRPQGVATMRRALDGLVTASGFSELAPLEAEPVPRNALKAAMALDAALAEAPMPEAAVPSAPQDAPPAAELHFEATHRVARPPIEPDVSADAALAPADVRAEPGAVRQRSKLPLVVAAALALGGTAFAAVMFLGGPASPPAAAAATTAAPLVAPTHTAAAEPGLAVAKPVSTPTSTPPTAIAEPAPVARAEVAPIRAPSHAAVDQPATSTKSATPPVAVARKSSPEPKPGRSEAPNVTTTTVSAASSKSPKQLCGDVNFVAMALCVSRQCQAPGLQSHPDCVEARRYDEQRRSRMEQ